MATLIALENVREFADAIGLNIALVTQTLALKAYSGFIERSPVDTGRFRANWQLGIGQANGTTTATTASPPDAPAGLRQITGEKRVFITNSLPYAEELENGSSRQAPNGIASLTIASLQGEIDASIA